MIELKVDQLPKAEDIRARLFLSTLSLAVSDQDIRLIRREAFPSLINMAVGTAIVLPAMQAARAQAQMQQAQGGGPGQPAVPGAPAGAPGQFGGAGAPPLGPGAPGAPGPGMRRRQGGGGPGARQRADD